MDHDPRTYTDFTEPIPDQDPPQLSAIINEYNS